MIPTQNDIKKAIEYIRQEEGKKLSEFNEYKLSLENRLAEKQLRGGK